jgi:hypothetical protein
MTYRPYPNPERARHQLDRHDDETPPLRPPRPLSQFERQFFEAASAAARAGGLAMAAMVEGFRRPVGSEETST